MQIGPIWQAKPLRSPSMAGAFSYKLATPATPPSGASAARQRSGFGAVAGSQVVSHAVGNDSETDEINMAERIVERGGVECYRVPVDSNGHE